MNDTRRRMAVPLLPGMRMQDPRSFAKPRTQTLAVKNGVHGVYKLVIAHPLSRTSHTGAGVWQPATYQRLRRSGPPILTRSVRNSVLPPRVAHAESGCPQRPGVRHGGSVREPVLAARVCGASSLQAPHAHTARTSKEPYAAVR
jgi:hypothetical protein